MPSGRVMVKCGADVQRLKMLLDWLVSEMCLLLFFYEILVDSTLATLRIGEQKFSCLQFARYLAFRSSALSFPGAKSP